MKEQPEPEGVQRQEPARRRFFAALGSGVSAALAGVAGLKLLQGKRAVASPPPPLAISTGEALLRMQRDLEDSLGSGKTPSWLMVVDTRKCIGCDACSVACRAENPTGPGANFRRVIQVELPISARQWAMFKPVNCLQCDDPPCARAVPQGMIYKRPDGIVEFNLASLKGQWATAAAKACPWGLIHVDEGKTFTQDAPRRQAYEERTFYESGRIYSRKPGANALEGSARKCTFCSHLLEARTLPACVTTCIGGAMYFGDANNPNSLVQEITQGRRVFAGHQDMGVKPRVVYFSESMPNAAHVDCRACH